MNKFKKVGLTALAGSLVVTSAVAGEMSVSGGASIGLKNTTKTSSGRSWTMGNQLTFSGSGELDNGMNVSLSFVLDQGDETTETSARSPFDSHSVTISSDSLGTLVFSGEGGSSASGAIDTTAAGDLWDNGSGFGTPASAEAGDNSMMYTLPSLMDDVTVKASYSPGSAGGPGATGFSVGFTGVEGLSVDLGVGDTETIGTTATQTVMKASYALGSFTATVSSNEYDYSLATQNDEETTSWQIAYTVSDDLSVSYGSETRDTATKTVDEEAEAINVSYTTGGVTISATQYEFTGRNNTTTESATGGDTERWALSATFAF